MAGSRAVASAALPWHDPLEAYRSLRAAGLQPALLLGAGAHPEARWSFVAFDPVRELRVQGPYVEETSATGSTATAGNVLGHLRAALGDVDDGPEPVPFTGGWVGWFAYEFARHVDPLFPKPHRTSVPDAGLKQFRCALSYDGATRQATLWCSDLDGDAALAAQRVRSAQAALAVRAARAPAAPSGEAEWETSLSEDQFVVATAQLRDRIRDGDLFQANLATRFSAPVGLDPADALERLRDGNPSPYQFLWEDVGFAIASGSPEGLLSLDAATRTLRSRPIAGTRRRGRDEPDDAAMAAELATDAKEQAEHTMLVDLVRNDLAQVCEPGSVHVPERALVERYRHVMHLASVVEGTLRPDRSFLDAFCALFPGGTITGAPKWRACQRIRESETVARGPYTGSAGYLSWSGNAAWNILIRTLVLEEDLADGTSVAHVHAGSGIVAGSDPEREWKEAGRKARALLQAATGGVTGGNPTRLGEASPTRAWRARDPPRRLEGRRVLLIDNEDSFVHNLADYCARLGATATVVRNACDVEAEVARVRPTHVVLGPGPGWPAQARATLDAARTLHGRLPVLGVCLGHQAIAHAHGGKVARHPAGPVHGEVAAVRHTGEGLFAGLASPLEATRYHSLVVVPGTLGAEWAVDATLEDGTVMAIRHRAHPTYGLQFHPESLCTDAGLEILARFLEARP